MPHLTLTNRLSSSIDGDLIYEYALAHLAARGAEAGAEAGAAVGAASIITSSDADDKKPNTTAFYVIIAVVLGIPLAVCLVRFVWTGLKQCATAQPRSKSPRTPEQHFLERQAVGAQHLRDIHGFDHRGSRHIDINEPHAVALASTWSPTDSDADVLDGIHYKEAVSTAPRYEYTQRHMADSPKALPAHEAMSRTAASQLLRDRIAANNAICGLTPAYQARYPRRDRRVAGTHPIVADPSFARCFQSRWSEDSS